MTNELIFLLYIFAVSGSTIIALKLGKEALVALLCIELVLANIFITKQVTLFGFTATASDALAVGATLSLNVVQEYYYKPAARHAIWISFFCSLFYMLVSILHLMYIPSQHDVSSLAYALILKPMPRVVMASLFVYVIVQYIDTALYGFLYRRLAGRHFIIRNYSSLALTQLLDTVLFSFIGLYGINESFTDLKTIFDIIVFSYIIKLLVICIAVPFTRFAKVFFHIQPPTL